MNGRMDDLLGPLQERAKELRCLYKVVEILGRLDAPLDEVFSRVVATVPDGWQYPGMCRAALRIGERVYRSSDFQPTPWVLRAPVDADEEGGGELAVYYIEPRPEAEEGPFLKGERQLLQTIAERISLFLLQRERAALRQAREEANGSVHRSDWRVVLDFLQRTDPHLGRSVALKMLNLLRWTGVTEIEEYLPGPGHGGNSEEANRPAPRSIGRNALPVDQIFATAERHYSPQDILGYIQMWLAQDKVGFLVSTVEEQSSSLGDITDALERFQVLGMAEDEMPRSVQTTVRVALLRRFFTDQIGFINTAKNLVTIDDFQDLVGRILHPPRSHGKLGGKSAGLFLARKVVEASAEVESMLDDIRFPRTWYITSDALLAFLRYNNLDDIHDRKYMDLEQVRQQYPHVVQVFKSCSFPPELVKGLSAVLDEMGTDPLIVRSSSLLEDRMGSAFSGKYKSLFLANQGTKSERLQALQDAIAEVYASVFGPDPIEYRAERNLLDVHEEMGVMIQKVVGRRVGKYYLPAFSGVAFSNNEFRWSPRIKREDGLVRLVPGLGTRAVDRLSDDYPVLLAPGQPGLRVNQSVDEVVRYSPKKIDLIDLESNEFRTMAMADLIAEAGEDIPRIRHMISLLDGDRLKRPRGLLDDIRRQPSVVTFEGLVSETAFVMRMGALLRVLQDRFGTPVDVEFATDGTHLYLLQCRPQSYAGLHAPPELPREIPTAQVLFSANRYISNGRVDAVTHVVYVDPDQYARITDLEKLHDVGRAVGRLNRILPRRHFILIGPGRWGSRGDIRLGVNVGYADISNTAVLVEIARKKGNYVPDLSFGTHFFQDLVESSIRYIPLYPDEPETRFNEYFLRRAQNLLPAILPEYAHLERVVRVVDVPASRGGKVLRILMNGELDQAVALFCDDVGTEGDPVAPAFTVDEQGVLPKSGPESPWGWRMAMAERIARDLDPDRFGVRSTWVFGSTASGTAEPDSELDLMLEFDGTEGQRTELLAWLEGWGRALDAANFLRTGRELPGLLRASLASAEDIERRRGSATTVHATAEAALLLASYQGGTARDGAG